MFCFITFSFLLLLLWSSKFRTIRTLFPINYLLPSLFTFRVSHDVSFLFPNEFPSRNIFVAVILSLQFIHIYISIYISLFFDWMIFKTFLFPFSYFFFVCNLVHPVVMKIASCTNKGSPLHWRIWYSFFTAVLFPSSKYSFWCLPEEKNLHRGIVLQWGFHMHQWHRCEFFFVKQNLSRKHTPSFIANNAVSLLLCHNERRSSNLK